MKYKSLMLCFAWCAFLGASAFGQTLTVTDLFVFPYDAANCSYPYGVQPLAPLMQAGDGNFYGTDASAGFSTGCPNDIQGEARFSRSLRWGWLPRYRFFRTTLKRGTIRPDTIRGAA